MPRTVSLYLIKPLCLLLVTAGSILHAADEPTRMQQPQAANTFTTPYIQNKPRVKAYPLEKAIGQAIRHHAKAPLAPADSTLAESRGKVDQLDVIQHRISNTVRKFEGKPVMPIVIKSSPHESSEIINLLQDGLKQIAALQIKQEKQQLQFNKQQIHQGIIKLVTGAYWRAIGAAKTRARTSSLLLQMQNISANPNLATAQKQKHARLLSALNQLKRDSDQDLQRLAAITDQQVDSLVPMLRVTNVTFAIPELSISPGRINRQSVTSISANPETLLADTKKYLLTITPGLAFDSENINNPDARLAQWLSTGKNIAFDLFIRIDQLEREQLLKETRQTPGNGPLLLAAASISSTQIAYQQYQQSIEKFQLAHCLELTSNRLLQISTVSLDNSIDSELLRISRQQDQLKLIRQQYADFADLQYWFYNLANSLDINTLPVDLEQRKPASIAQAVLDELGKLRKTRGIDSFSCYTSAEETARQAGKMAALQQAEREARKKSEKLLTEIAAVKKIARENNAKADWIMQQSPNAYSLQIASGSNRKHLKNYITRHNLDSNAFIYSSRWKGKTVYQLLYGVYKDKELAFIGQFKLPQAVLKGNDIRIRRFAEIQKSR